MDKNLLLTILTTVIVTVVTSHYSTYLTKKKISPNKDGILKLKMSKYYLIGGLTSLLSAFPFFLGFLIFAIKGKLMSCLFLSFLLFFLYLAFMCFQLYFNHWVEFDEEYVIVNSWRNQNVIFSWNDIERIKRNIWSGNLIIILKDSQKVKVQLSSIGFATFLQFLETKTGLKP